MPTRLQYRLALRSKQLIVDLSKSLKLTYFYRNPSLEDFFVMSSDQEFFESLPVHLEKIGDRLVIRSQPSYFPYFEALRGKYDQNEETWTFPARQEAQVGDLVQRILTGHLPPPSQLAVPSAEEIGIGLSVPTEVPSQQLTFGGTSVAPLPSRTPKPRQRIPAPPPPPTVPVLPAPPSISSVPEIPSLPVPPVELPQYDPTAREPGESQAEYDRRIGLYQYLVQNIPGISQSSADVLSRMRNDVDILGVLYDETSMQILNAYLPIQQ